MHGTRTQKHVRITGINFYSTLWMAVPQQSSRPPPLEAGLAYPAHLTGMANKCVKVSSIPLCVKVSSIPFCPHIVLIIMTHPMS